MNPTARVHFEGKEVQKTSSSCSYYSRGTPESTSTAALLPRTTINNGIPMEKILGIDLNSFNCCQKEVSMFLFGKKALKYVPLNCPPCF